MTLEFDPSNAYIRLSGSWDPKAQLMCVFSGSTYGGSGGMSYYTKSYYDPALTEDNWCAIGADGQEEWRLTKATKGWVFEQSFKQNVVDNSWILTIEQSNLLSEEHLDRWFAVKGLGPLRPHWREVFWYQAELGLRLSEYDRERLGYSEVRLYLDPSYADIFPEKTFEEVDENYGLLLGVRRAGK